MYNCLIIDDEPIAIEIIESYLEKLPSFRVTGTCRDAFKAMETMKTRSIDLLFLDIEMPGITGMDLLKIMDKPPRVVITTAYRNYAVESYEYEVMDYLLKPISFKRFMKAIDKFLKLEGPTPREEKGHLLVKEGKDNIWLPIEKIFYIEGMKDYVKIHTREGSHVTYQTLLYFEEILKEKGFSRIHKSYIVNIDKIKTYSRSEVHLNSINLPIGRVYKDEVMARFQKK